MRMIGAADELCIKQICDRFLKSESQGNLIPGSQKRLRCDKSAAAAHACG